MPLAANEQIHTPLPPETGELHNAREQGLAERLRIAGRNVLAIAGVALALGTAAHKISSASAEDVPAAGGQPNISQPDDNSLEPAPITANPSSFESGIATYSWHTEGRSNLFTDMADANMTGVRLNIVRENSEHDLSVFNHELPNIEASGIEPVLLLQHSPDASIDGYADWAAQTVEATPQVSRYVIDNEPNNPMFWTGTMKQYANMLHQTYVAIHEVRPDAIVSGVGLDSIDKDRPEEWFQHFLSYVDRQWGEPSAVMDTLSMHVYGTPWKASSRIQAIEEMYSGPINIDEAGAILGRVNEQQQAEYDADLLALAAKDAQVRNVFFYRMKNSTDPDDIHAGLKTPEGIKLPAFFAVQYMNSRVTDPSDSPIPTGPIAASSG